jgi:hypothetical protein
LFERSECTSMYLALFNDTVTLISFGTRLVPQDNTRAPPFRDFFDQRRKESPPQLSDPSATERHHRKRR